MNGCCCVEASTLVLMADGSQRPIRDLRIGDLVRTETGTAHIRDIIKGREPELVRIGLAQGGNLVATGNHPLFTDDAARSSWTIGFARRAAASPSKASSSLRTSPRRAI